MGAGEALLVIGAAGAAGIALLSRFKSESPASQSGEIPVGAAITPGQTAPYINPLDAAAQKEIDRLKEEAEEEVAETFDEYRDEVVGSTIGVAVASTTTSIGATIAAMAGPAIIVYGIFKIGESVNAPMYLAKLLGGGGFEPSCALQSPQDASIITKNEWTRNKWAIRITTHRIKNPNYGKDAKEPYYTYVAPEEWVNFLDKYFPDGGEIRFLNKNQNEFCETPGGDPCKRYCVRKGMMYLIPNDQSYDSINIGVQPKPIADYGLPYLRESQKANLLKPSTSMDNYERSGLEGAFRADGYAVNSNPNFVPQSTIKNLKILYPSGGTYFFKTIPSPQGPRDWRVVSPNDPRAGIWFQPKYPEENTAGKVQTMTTGFAGASMKGLWDIFGSSQATDKQVGKEVLLSYYDEASQFPSFPYSSYEAWLIYVNSKGIADFESAVGELVNMNVASTTVGQASNRVADLANKSQGTAKNQDIIMAAGGKGDTINWAVAVPEIASETASDLVDVAQKFGNVLPYAIGAGALLFIVLKATSGKR